MRVQRLTTGASDFSSPRGTQFHMLNDEEKFGDAVSEKSSEDGSPKKFRQSPTKRGLTALQPLDKLLAMKE